MPRSRPIARSMLVAPLLAWVSLTSACASSSGDDSAPDRLSPGPAAVQVRPRIAPGSELDSRFVAPEKHYVSFRKVVSLGSLGALTGPLRPLAERIDGSDLTGPSDGVITVEELVAIEHGSTLRSDELPLLGQLWPLFEVESTATDLHASEPDLIDGVRETWTPARIDRRSGVGIASLAAELRTLAQQIEAVTDSDEDATTISLSDLDAASSSHADEFEPADLAKFPDIGTVARTFAIAHLGTSAYVLDVPMPRETTERIAVGPMHVAVTEAFRVTEHRRYREMEGNLTVEHSFAATIELVPDVTFNVIDLEVGTETSELAEDGNMVLEAWKNGVRLGHRRVHYTALSNERHLPGHADPVSDGQPLHRNASSNDPANVAVFETASGATAFARDVPQVHLRPGVYRPAADDAPWRGIELEVYGDDIVFVQMDFQRLRLVPDMTTGIFTDYLMTDGRTIAFEAATSELTHAFFGKVILTDEHLQ